MDEPVIYREEAVALLFTVTDISITLIKMYELVGGDDAEERDEG
jgi:hypothetical protein